MKNDLLLIRRYLLGELPEADAERFEEEYFADDDRFAEMLAAEDDLIEDFLRDRLQPAEHRLFEARFLATPRGLTKVELAAALEKTSSATRRTPPARALAIAAAVAVVAIGAAMMREIVVMRHQIDRLQSERPTPRAVTAPRPRDVFSLVLTGGSERGSASAATIVLPGHPVTAELWLVVPHDDYPAYTAALQTIDGHTLHVDHALASRPLDDREAILFRIPSETLEPGTYIVAVSGDKAGAQSEPIEDFSFTVRRL